MSTPEHPRPLPPEVYRRRRLLVFGGLAVVIVVLALILWPRGGGDAAGGKSPSPSPTVSKGLADLNPSGKASGAAATTCSPSAITVTAVLDKTNYGADQQPQMSMTITNSSATACSVDVGTAAQEFTITSGEDRIWDSKDCQTDPTNDVRTIDAGQSLSTAALPWERVRSDPSTCDQTNRTPATGGGATYRLQVKLGAIQSEQLLFVLA
ncbi:hypothetical protein [Schumannella soli]|uniref:DUF4232 domain-containing protein n=1 Tax=Schumannella soli TaxID=2590779 RepID=A0A506XY65_9MICO|nr:hypothetical protein [Schumannella soli]TPW74227.1 hypothetical protein FJ657_16520 [Schumannella soli]